MKIIQVIRIPLMYISLSSQGFRDTFKMYMRGLNCQGRGTSFHSTPTSLIPVPARDAQSLERDLRSVGGHLKSSKRNFSQ